MSRIPQAGAIAFKIADDGTIRILIVRAKKTPDDWIFPKGHIEDGETAEDAARRELEEEAGVSGESLGLVGSLDFQSGKEMVTCEYYLVRFDRDVPRKEKRDIRWSEYDEALTLLTHRDAAELLKKALPVIESHRS
ncbi:MAG TPA: NUDIX domain-containing protein [Pyrinomonadaceae bacterium]|nr:NUDIX domain-containing protein [Pyrinomonadaceae bacterium]